jgi:hypothetical protein
MYSGICTTIEAASSSELFETARSSGMTIDKYYGSQKTCCPLLQELAWVLLAEVRDCTWRQTSCVTSSFVCPSWTWQTKPFQFMVFYLISVLVWTPCLMHRCVYLTVHITKLQVQTTFSKPLYLYINSAHGPLKWYFWMALLCGQGPGRVGVAGAWEYQN